MEPIWVQRGPRRADAEPLTIMSGSGELLDSQESTQEQAFHVQLAEPSDLQLNTTYFPGWVVRVDGTPVPVQADNPQGLMQVSVGAGEHTILAQFTDTPVRQWGTRVSLVTLLGLLLTCLPLPVWRPRRVRGSSAWHPRPT
jgi:hypothetical protein